ncbi:MAG: ribosome small subunit-dependent GTPase A [Oscillospiraceae bacterium]|nr:ribosome small subunit-dependent GTPase A [Oscillospiraceae bacterium]
MTGTIIKALSGFYYVDCGGETITCRARGKFRHSGISPLVGDRVEITPLGGDNGSVEQILERKNAFSRPAVANMDALIMIAAGVNPVTDPFLIDRVAAIAEQKHCEPIIVWNKCDLEPCDALCAVYADAGFTSIQVSAATGAGISALSDAIAGKTVVFTGNSGVGKSSILNRLDPALSIETGEVSEKLGRGRHTTRHVELFRLPNGALAADTPGFASFDTEVPELLDRETLGEAFREFRPYLGECRFVGCSHTKEKGCAVLAALDAGQISPSRHRSYCRLYEAAKQYKEWEH